jgi:uncharacterized protein (TIGR02145 family)
MKTKDRNWPYLLITVIILLSGCKKDDGNLFGINPWVDYGNMTDQNGNIYKTIKIGTQTWMVRNLATTKYNDGTSIPEVSDATSWSKLTTPGCCWQNNDTIRKVTYGVLYNWYTVKTGKLCPIDWHVSTDADWITLTDYLGGENISGGKLKESGFRHWNSPNTGATNEVYFWAFPGGTRLNGPDALFDNLGEMGCWWTDTSEGEWAINRLIYDNSIKVQKSYYPKQWGLSVRCVRDY